MNGVSPELMGLVLKWLAKRHGNNPVGWEFVEEIRKRLEWVEQEYAKYQKEEKRK